MQIIHFIHYSLFIIYFVFAERRDKESNWEI